MELNPNDPLDRVVMPTSNNWLPNLKAPQLGFIGRTLHQPNITRKPILIKLKGRKQFIDVVKQRQIARNKLLNQKAKHYDDLIKDAIEVNDVEQRYLMRKRELERIEAKFKAGVLAFFTEGVVKQAETKLIEDVMRQDPDLIQFDDETSKIISKSQELQDLRQSNIEEQESLQQEVRQMDEDIEQMIAEVETPQDMEVVSQLIEERSALPLGTIEEEEEDVDFSESDVSSSGFFSDIQVLYEGDISEISEEEITGELQEEERIADRIDDEAKRIRDFRKAMRGMSLRKPRTPRKDTLVKAQSILSDIERLVQLYEEKTSDEPKKRPRKIKRIISRVQSGDLRLTHEANPKPKILEGMRIQLADALTSIMIGTETAIPRI